MNSLAAKLQHSLARVPWLAPVLASLIVVVVYSLTVFHNPLGLRDGDPDFFYSMSEAARRIILEYHQFPWWNPWVAGGIPLFADPQFGLFSIHTALTFVFGTVIGWKVAIIAYILMGLFGFRKLFIDVFKTPQFTALLLSLTWALSWLWAARGVGGHYTFFVLNFLPWLMWLYFHRQSVKKSWLKFGLLLALLLNTSIHNMTFMSLVLFAVFVLADFTYESIQSKKGRLVLQALKERAIYFGKALLITLPLAGLKIYTTVALSRDFNRAGMNPMEPFPGFELLFQSLAGVRVPGMESAVGIGFGMVFLAVIAVGWAVWHYVFRNQKAQPIMQNTAFYAVLGIGFFTLTFGDSHSWLPYNILRELPIFEETRVAVRWLIFAGLMIIFVVALLKTNKRWQRQVINAILIANLIVISAGTIRFLRENPYIVQDTSGDAQTAVISQRSMWGTPRQSAGEIDENLYSGVKNNVGQVTSMLIPYYDTRHNETFLCGENIDSNCHFVRTDNAEVTYWSPNKITLKRTGDGPILLNMSLGKHWRVNGQYVFSGTKATNVNTPLYINDESKIITLDLAPKL